MYNKKQIDKNVALIGNATEECLEKLASGVIPEWKTEEIENRLETNFHLVDTAMLSLVRFLPDQYIETKMKELRHYENLWKNYKFSQRAEEANKLLNREVLERQLVVVL